MAFTANDTFCAITDVESRVGRGAFHASATVPTIQQTLDFMAMRAQEIQAAILRGGASYTVPSGSNAFGSPTDTAVLALKLMCQNANALAAAADAINARDVRDNPDANTVAGDLFAQYLRLIGSEEEAGQIEQHIKEEINTGRSAVYAVTTDSVWPTFDSDTKW